MRVAKIRIQNILGIENLEFAPGAITVLEGPNGVGKSSVVEAIRAALEGGHDGTLVRNGADAGEVVLILDDDTEIRKRISRERSAVSVTRPDGAVVKGPQGYLSKLADALSVNPVSFLTATPKQQAEYLLQCLPLELHEDAVCEAVEGALEVHDSELRGHPLDVLSALHKRVYDERTGVNRAGKEKQGTIDQLSGSLPSDPLTQSNLDDAIGQMEAHAGALRERRDRETATHRAEYMRTVDAEKDRAEQEIAATRARLEAALDAARVRAEEAIRQVRIQAEPAIEAHTRDLATLREQARSQAAIDNTRRVVATLASEVESLRGRSQAMTEALARLDALKLGLLERLPIKGLSIVDGVIHRDGVPFSRVNRAEQVKVALALARLRAGDLKLICVDGLECLDTPTFNTFRDRVSKTDLQMVVTRVGDTAGLVVQTAGVQALQGVGS